MELRYFAYGSNLCLTRLRSRVPGVRPLGPALLRGYVLRWHKRSVDHSGKCSIARSDDAASIVHGALFAIPRSEKYRLDDAEGLGKGYDEIMVSVESSDGDESAYTYVAAPSHIDDTLRPYTWYKDLVVAGAESHDLPPRYLAMLRLVAAEADPDTDRDSSERKFLPCRPQ